MLYICCKIVWKIRVLSDQYRFNTNFNTRKLLIYKDFSVIFGKGTKRSEQGLENQYSPKFQLSENTI